MDLSVGLCVQVAAAMAVHARHSCWSRPEQAAAAVEQSARLFVAAASPSHRTSWHTRASTRTIVGMSTERWCPLNMVWLNRRSAAHRVLRRPAASSQLSPEQSASSPRSTTGPPRHAPHLPFSQASRRADEQASAPQRSEPSRDGRAQEKGPNAANLEQARRQDRAVERGGLRPAAPADARTPERAGAQSRSRGSGGETSGAGSRGKAGVRGCWKPGARRPRNS